MGTRWTQGSIRDSALRFKTAGAAIDAATAANLKDAGENITEFAQGIIENSGTGEWSREWDGKSASSPGRVTTGSMRDDYEYDVTKMSGVQRLRVGWIKNFQKYYGWQNDGFEWKRFGRSIGLFVEGMMLQIRIKKITESEIDKAGKQVLRGLVRHLQGGK